ncbi:hypothetical protein B6N60_04384 [Richelia sinica FACHB-800]|uniref:DUF4238 domain-containing protein n=1 Tax=Richelia sinica FACHB-800 TaxID=1357546 RepID=A0A975Y6V7_9NOST|nr:DUF4238 domain-containing protein [Richelia sinica]MBD2665473.1 DUF4238 domain-containing protein [Richelia sinica FACHB-800]QXE25664.1 hypothetical protein B6N60_04384 [Richelia sinica FACHB-800]
MSKVINQHYVPQSYLKNFSLHNSQVFVFDKLNQKIFTSHVKNVASERFFNDFPGDATQLKKIQMMEELYSQLEMKQNRFLRHIKKKINNIFDLRFHHNKSEKAYLTNILTREQRNDLACITAIQFLRTKKFRNFLFEIQQNQVTKTLISEILEQSSFDFIKQFQVINDMQFNPNQFDWIEDFIVEQSTKNIDYIYKDCLSVVHAKFIMTYYDKVAKIFDNHIWIIGINNTEQHLFTSDNPVVSHAHLSSNGIASEGIEIVFPIDGKLILIMKDKLYFNEYIDRNNRLIILKSNDVDYYNSLQVYNSNRQIFCSQNMFSLAREICQQKPEICSQNII